MRFVLPSREILTDRIQELFSVEPVKLCTQFQVQRLYILSVRTKADADMHRAVDLAMHPPTL